MKTLALIFLILLGTTSAAYACSYNGRTYPEGTTIGPYTCRNGTWVRL
jgi:hypothetical protein